METRKKKVLAVLCVGSVILVWRLYALIEHLPSSAQANSTASSEAEVQQAEGSDSAQVEQAEIWLLQQETASQAWSRDPFADVPGAKRIIEPDSGPAEEPVAEAPPSPPPMQLSGVSKSGDEWLAVVGGRIIRVGDVIDEEFAVTEITKRAVTVTSGGWSFRFEIGAESASIRPLSEEP